MAESASESRIRVRLRVPKAVLKRGRPPGRIAQYDSEIIKYNNMHYLPMRIADLLCREHDLDPAVMNRKSVERRLRTIKAKGLAKLAPVNEDSDLVARDAPKRCTYFSDLFLLLNFFLFFEGQNSAITLAEGLEEGDIIDEKEEEIEDDTNDDDTAVTLAHFKDAGFLYTEEGESHWVIFIARNLNSDVRLVEVRDDGILLTWTPTPPSDAAIIAVKDITFMAASQMNVQRSSCSLFVPSPRQISKDSSKLKKALTPPAPATAEWLVLSVPFVGVAEDLGIELAAFKPNQ